MQRYESRSMEIADPAYFSRGTQFHRYNDLAIARPFVSDAPVALSGKGLRTIVVPLDGTASAEHALPPALALARRSGATVRIVHAWSRLDSINPWQMMSAAEQITPTEREKQNYLSDVVKRIERLDHSHLETALLDSMDIEDALVRGASGSDLVVLASRRRSRVSRLWWNSMADRLRRRLTMPLLMTHSDSSAADLTADPIARHILVPLDGSILAQSILQHAVEFARLEGASMTLLNVQNENGTGGFFEHTTPRDYLLTAMRKLQLSATIVEAHVITTSRNVVEAIASFAEQSETDLVALATRADSGLSRLMRGSVADGLLRQTKLPLLIRNFDGHF